MESDLANPPAEAWDDTIEDTAVELTVQPHAIFADMTIQGSFTGNPSAPAVEAVANAARASSGIDPKWIAVLAIVVIVIGGVALWNQQKG